MFYLIDTHGTTTAVYTEPIYQGSVGVNDITLFAPFPANAQITVFARLSNGLELQNLEFLEAKPYQSGMPILKDTNGNAFTAFVGTIDKSLTSVPGLVEIWFRVTLGVGRVLDTYKTSFNVVEGGAVEPVTLPTDEDYLNAVLQYLANINSDPLKSVVYKTDNQYLVLPTSVTGNALTNTDPNATVDYIGGTDYFSATIANIRLNITFDYDTSFNAELVQFWLTTPTVAPLEITVNASHNNAPVVSTLLTVKNATGSFEINPRAFLGSKEIDKISFSISAQEQIIIKGIQVFKQNTKGEYVFTMRSGAQAIINAPDGAMIESYFERASAAARSAETSATSAADSASQASNSASSASASEENAFNLRNEAGAYADQASASASSASNSAAEAYRYLEIFMTRQRVYYEATLVLALGAIANTVTLYDGDLFIIGQKEVPDLIVFENKSEALANAPSITAEQVQNGTFPQITAGDRYKITGGRAPYGFVALETGVDTTNFITRAEWQAVNNGFNNRITALESQIGDVRTALTNIIALQNSYINGGNL